ncbi:MAG TPA: DoxX family protein [Thermoanaerobaculia bacterium]|nr:DoxX family protein [Thermoanaerobaculia bacterium]
MPKVIGRFSPQIFAIMRIVTGLLFACHGSQKLLNWPPGDMHPRLASLAGVSGVIELVCGLLIAVGFLTGIAAFIASGEMAVAFFIAHFPHGPIPLLNKGELAVVYCFLWLFVAAHGAGIWSIDEAMRKKR